MNALNKINPVLFLLLLAIPYTIGIGSVHLFDWDEVNFAECAREMIASGNYTTVQIGFEPFWEKPPLFIWLQALCMQVFGVNEFAARLPNALIGFATLFTIYKVGLKLQGKAFGLLWAMVYTASLLPHFYFKFGIIDPLFNLFIFLSIDQFIKVYETRPNSLTPALLCGLYSGLGVLTKGPVAVLLLVLTVGVFLLINRFKNFPPIKHFIAYIAALCLVMGSWFAVNILNNGWSLFWQFINYQVELFTQPVAGHQQPFYYHFLVVLLGCFPLSFLALSAFKKQPNGLAIPFNHSLWMKVLFWVVMILFTIVKTKIVHYSSMAYLPLSFLAASQVYLMSQQGTGLKRLLSIVLVLIPVLLGLLLLAIPITMQFRDQWMPLLKFIKDRFTQESLKIVTDWPVFTFAPGLIMLIIGAYNYTNYRKGKLIEALAMQTVATTAVMVILFTTLLPRIEPYTQGPMVEFIKSKADGKAYVAPWGFKSYTHYFYGQMPADADKQADNADYLLNNKLDRPAFLIAKVGNHDADLNPKVKFLYQQGGFKFYEVIGNRE